MTTEPIEISLNANAATREHRAPHCARLAPAPQATGSAAITPSPAAFDEIFAKLSRNRDRMSRSDTCKPNQDTRNPASHPGTDQPSKPQVAGLGAIPALADDAEPRGIDAAGIRDVAMELDQQCERLAQLLRDIEAD